MGRLMSLLKTLAAGKAHVNAPGLGIACALLASFLIVMNDTTMKAVTKGVPVGELISLRAGVVMALVALYVWISGRSGELRVYHVKAQAIRASMMVIGSFLFVAALRVMPLADVSALLFLAPLMMTAMAPAFLGESVGWRRWSAVLVGFAGMIVMLRPSADGLYWLALLPAASALTSAFRDLLTRRISAQDSTWATLFYSTAAVFVASTLTLPFAWQTPTWSDMAFLVLGGVLQLVAHFFMIEMFRFIEVSAVAPFKYLGLVWAALSGFVFFGEVPDIWTAVGAALIIGGGLYIINRERAHRRAIVLKATPGEG